MRPNLLFPCIMEMASAFSGFRHPVLPPQTLGIFGALAKCKEASTPPRWPLPSGFDARAASLIMDACVAVGLLQKEGSVYRNTRPKPPRSSSPAVLAISLEGNLVYAGCLLSVVGPSQGIRPERQARRIGAIASGRRRSPHARVRHVDAWQSARHRRGCNRQAADGRLPSPVGRRRRDRERIR